MKLTSTAQRHVSPCVCLAAACAMAVLSGCKSVHWNKADFTRQDARAEREKEEKNKNNKKGENYGNPQKIGVVWRDGIYESDQGPTTRGIGGRVFFYDSSEKPVKVDGELIVYAFNDTASPDSNTADRKYVFPADKLQDHFSESALGPSYSIWLPWDIVGGPQTNVTLIPMFRTADGRIVKGFQGLVVVQDPTGKNKKKPVGASNVAGPAVQRIDSSIRGNSESASPASWEEGGDEVTNVVQTRFEQRRVTTIPVPAETARRMGEGQPSGNPSTSGQRPAQSLPAGPSAAVGASSSPAAVRAGQDSSRPGPQRESPWSAFRPLNQTRNPSEPSPLDSGTGF